MAILWVSLVIYTAIALCVASQWVFIVVSLYFFIDWVRKLLDTPSYTSNEVSRVSRLWCFKLRTSRSVTTQKTSTWNDKFIKFYAKQLPAHPESVRLLISPLVSCFCGLNSWTYNIMKLNIRQEGNLTSGGRHVSPGVATPSPDAPGCCFHLKGCVRTVTAALFQVKARVKLSSCLIKYHTVKT